MRLTYLSLGVLSLALSACCTPKKKVMPMHAEEAPVCVIKVTDRVFFDFDRSSLRPEGKSVLDQQAEWFKNHSKDEILIEGHTDVRGKASYNMKLGKRRADAVRDYLVGKGINASRIRTVSYGETRPDVVNAKTSEDHQKNRRAVTVIN